MLERGPLKASIDIDYHKSVEEIYEGATESIITHEQYLYNFLDLTCEPSARLFTNLPSWVSTYYEKIMFMSTSFDYIAETLETERQFHVSGGVLTVYGIILDTVKEVSKNMSPRNFKDLILTVISAELAIGSNVKFINISPQELEAAAHHILDWVDTRRPGHKIDKQSLISLICKWIRHDLRQLTKRPPNSRYLTGHPLSKWCKEYLIEGVPYEDVVSKDEKLMWMFNQTRVMPWDEAEWKLAEDLFLDEEDGLGRNLFRSEKEFRGVGPAGFNSEGSKPAVQIGDHIIALFARSAAPVILRPLEAGYYTLIGTANIADLDNAPIFQQGEISELEEIRIR
jgi:hypothetical protein